MTEAEWTAVLQLDSVGRKLIEAYRTLCDLDKGEAACILAAAIQQLRGTIPNAFPATYNED